MPEDISAYSQAKPTDAINTRPYTTSPTLTQQQVQDQVRAEQLAGNIARGNAALAAGGANVTSSPEIVQVGNSYAAAVSSGVNNKGVETPSTQVTQSLTRVNQSEVYQGNPLGGMVNANQSPPPMPNLLKPVDPMMYLLSPNDQMVYSTKKYGPSVLITDDNAPTVVKIKASSGEQKNSFEVSSQLDKPFFLQSEINDLYSKTEATLGEPGPGKVAANLAFLGIGAAQGITETSTATTRSIVTQPVETLKSVFDVNNLVNYPLMIGKGVVSGVQGGEYYSAGQNIGNWEFNSLLVKGASSVGKGALGATGLKIEGVQLPAKAGYVATIADSSIVKLPLEVGNALKSFLEQPKEAATVKAGIADALNDLGLKTPAVKVGATWQEQAGYTYAGTLQVEPKVSGSVIKDFGAETVNGVVLSKSATPLRVSESVVDASNFKPVLYDGFTPFKGEMIEAPNKPVSVYTGLTATIAGRKYGLFGLSEQGNVVVGRFPSVVETPVLSSFKSTLGEVDASGNLKYRPSTLLETEIVTQDSFLKELGAKDTANLRFARKAMFETAGYKPSLKVRLSDFVEKTKTLSPSLSKVSLAGFAKDIKQVQEVYGSHPTQSFIVKSLQRTPGDTEAALKTTRFGEAQAFSISRAFELKEAGSKVTLVKVPYANIDLIIPIKNPSSLKSVITEGPTVSTKGLKGYEDGHALDIHYAGEETPGSGSESVQAKSNEAYGRSLTGKYTKLGKFNNVVGFEAQFNRKLGDSVAAFRVTKEGELVFQPAAHRIKDVADTYQMLRSQAIDYGSRRAFSFTARSFYSQKVTKLNALAEEIKTLDFTKGLSGEQKFSIQKELNEKFAEVDAGIYKPSKPAITKIYPREPVSRTPVVSAVVAKSGLKLAASPTTSVSSYYQKRSSTRSLSLSPSNSQKPSTGSSASKSTSSNSVSKSTSSNSVSKYYSSRTLSPSLISIGSSSQSTSSSSTSKSSSSGSISSIPPSIISKSPSSPSKSTSSKSVTSIVSIPPSNKKSKLSNLKVKKSFYKFTQSSKRSKQGVVVDYFSGFVSQLKTGRSTTPSGPKATKAFENAVNKGAQFFKSKELNTAKVKVLW